MSHYTVAVFANSPYDFDALLEPYNENSHFTAHYYEEDELREKYKKFLEQNPSWEKHGFDYYLEEMGYKREDGKIVAYYNDNAKWDYYLLDGREYLFDLKKKALKRAKEEECWRFRKNDYKYNVPVEGYDPKFDARFWELVVEEQPLRDGEKMPFSLYTKEYYLERYGTKENYIKSGSRLRPFAFVTPDGVWHSPGDVGWFAIDDSTAESNARYEREWDDYIASDDNPYVSFVDCHI